MRKLYATVAMALAVATTWAQTAAGESVKFTGNDFATKGAAMLPDASQIISEQPEGTVYKMYRQCDAFDVGIDGYAYRKARDGYAADVVISADGKKFYLQNPICTFDTGWIVGDIDAMGTVTFNFPQAVYNSTSTGTMYAYKMIVDEDAGKVTVDKSTQSVQFKWSASDKSLKQMAYTDAIGLVGSDGKWARYASMDNVLIEQTDQVVTPTLGIKPESYLLSYTDYSTSAAVTKDVDVVFDGDDIYLGGFYKNCWIKGTKEDNKLIFPKGQYLGTETIRNTVHEYMFPFSISEDNSSSTLLDNLEFKYNKTTGEWTSTNVISVYMGKYYGGVLEAFKAPTLKKANYAVEVPAKPTISTVFPFNANGDETGAVVYALSNLSESGKELRTSNIVYNVYLDGKLHTFKPASYVYLTEEMTDIPYSFIDKKVTQSSGGVGHDFMLYNGNQCVFIYNSFIKIGVKAVYIDGNTRLESAMAEFDTIDGISGAEAENADVKSVTYHDLNGCQLSAPAKGISIKSIEYSNGEKKTVKIMK